MISTICALAYRTVALLYFASKNVLPGRNGETLKAILLNTAAFIVFARVSNSLRLTIDTYGEILMTSILYTDVFVLGFILLNSAFRFKELKKARSLLWRTDSGSS